MATFFTSDLHLGHNNIIPSRPQFTDIEEHDEYLISKWNKKVRDKDDVYILGDLSFRAVHDISYYLRNMRGRKHLIVGNHDEQWMKRAGDLLDFFETVDYLKIMKFEKKKITLCHYPMLEFPGSRYVEQEACYLIHGHIHANKDEDVYGYIKRCQPHALNASVDINGFEPVTFEELKENNYVWYERG